MAIGNTWVYVDSTFNTQGALLRVDTFALSVTQLKFDSTRGGEYWWTLTGASDIPFPSTGSGGAGHLMQRNDTIFGLEANGWEPGVNTQAKFGAIPASKDSVIYPWVYGGDVLVGTFGVRNGGSYFTPAGTFTGSLSFDFSVFEEKRFEFKPGVGILGYRYATGWTPQASHRGRLLEYSLKL